MKRICAGCIYFHPEEYEEEFGGCGVTIDYEKRAFCDTCVDFSEFDVVYPKRPTFPGRCLTRTELDILMHLGHSR